MSQIDLLISDADRSELLKWVLRQGASIVPDAHFEQATYWSVTSSDQLSRLLDHRQYFLLRSDWQQEDLVMRPVVNIERGQGFYIAQRQGGPALNLLLYPETQEVSPVLGRGALHYYPFYYSGADRRQIAPPGPMKDFFADFAKRLKSEGVSLKGKERVAWLSHASAAAVSAGALQVPSEWSACAKWLNEAN